MSKNSLDTTDIVNELSGQSAFFQEPKKTDEPVRSDVSDGGDGPERVIPAPSAQRIIRRHSYEIYEDQVLSLQKMKLEFMMQGELKSMSSMVREALDEYLIQHQTRSGRTER